MRIHKSDIVKSQLETAVWLFLDGRDRSSVITLAGAASGILDRLVRNAGEEPFVDYACRLHRELIGNTPKRRSYSHHIDKKLGVTVHKHLAEEEPETIELDLDEMALNALSRAIADYIALNGQSEGFVRAFLGWAWENTDGEALMERFKNVPDKMKPQRC
jgi:hypothetical protein